MKTFLVDRNGKLSFEEVDMPAYGPREALVKMISCGLCGTDVKLLHRTFKGYPEEMYPVMLGHEGVGEVVALGSEVKGLKIGDKVLLPFLEASAVGRDDIGSAWGALSEYAVVCDPAAFPEGDAPDYAYGQTVLEDDIDPVDAAMIVTFREVLSCIRHIGIVSGESVVVYGCGPVGLTYIKLMSLLGVKDIVACDIVPEKLEEAKRMGAANIINNAESDVYEAVRKLYPDGVDYVLDAVGLPAIVNQAMPLIRDRGKVICYGVPEKSEITIDFSKAVYNWQLIYQQFPKKREEGEAHEQIIKWLRSGELVLGDFISDYFDFADTAEACEKLLAKKISKKSIVRM